MNNTLYFKYMNEGSPTPGSTEGARDLDQKETAVRLAVGELVRELERIPKSELKKDRLHMLVTEIVYKAAGREAGELVRYVLTTSTNQMKKDDIPAIVRESGYY